jgi:hypothetical protein
MEMTEGAGRELVSIFTSLNGTLSRMAKALEEREKRKGREAEDKRIAGYKAQQQKQKAVSAKA